MKTILPDMNTVLDPEIEAQVIDDCQRFLNGRKTLEELTYIMGQCSARLMLLGCPIGKQIQDLETIVDGWANKF